MKEGAVGSSMHILHRGEAEVLVGQTSVAKLGSGVVFGEMMLLGLAERRTATVRALEFCDCRVIQRTVLMRLMKMFPREKEKFKALARERLAELQTISLQEEKRRLTCKLLLPPLGQLISRSPSRTKGSRQHSAVSSRNPTPPPLLPRSLTCHSPGHPFNCEERERSVSADRLVLASTDSPMSWKAQRALSKRTFAVDTGLQSSTDWEPDSDLSERNVADLSDQNVRRMMARSLAPSPCADLFGPVVDTESRTVPRPHSSLAEAIDAEGRRISSHAIIGGNVCQGARSGFGQSFLLEESSEPFKPASAPTDACACSPTASCSSHRISAIEDRSFARRGQGVANGVAASTSFCTTTPQSPRRAQTSVSLMSHRGPGPKPQVPRPAPRSRRAISPLAVPSRAATSSRSPVRFAARPGAEKSPPVSANSPCRSQLHAEPPRIAARKPLRSAICQGFVEADPWSPSLNSTRMARLLMLPDASRRETRTSDDPSKFAMYGLASSTAPGRTSGGLRPTRPRQHASPGRPGSLMNSAAAAALRGDLSGV